MGNNEIRIARLEDVGERPFSSLTDDELAERIRQLELAVALERTAEVGHAAD